MDAEEAVISEVSHSQSGTRRQNGWKWGLGGLGALGIGLTACSVVCSFLVPLLLVAGAGTVAVSFVEAGAKVAGSVLVVGGLAAIALSAIGWWRQRRRRRCGCDGGPASLRRCGDSAGPSAPAEREPIACTLDGQGVRRRLNEFRAAFEGNYLASERFDGGVRWRFRAAAGLLPRLRSLADREHECCRFFLFEIRVAGDEVWWDSRVDDVEAQPILDEFFNLPHQLAKPGGVDGAVFWPGHREDARE